uniref:Uncharacterized protein n=1 Tax=Noctiluca scintillans TaxID=2966 RepID=A0A7S1A142_NOCSC
MNHPADGPGCETPGVPWTSAALHEGLHPSCVSFPGWVSCLLTGFVLFFVLNVTDSASPSCEGSNGEVSGGWSLKPRRMILDDFPFREALRRRLCLLSFEPSRRRSRLRDSRCSLDFGRFARGSPSVLRFLSRLGLLSFDRLRAFFRLERDRLRFAVLRGIQRGGVWRLVAETEAHDSRRFPIPRSAPPAAVPPLF